MGKLILIVDIDDDIGRKAKLSTPIVGENQCIEAALKLILSDPEDPDANVIFKGVKIIRSLKRKEKDIEIAIIAGHKDLGIKATKRVSQQIEFLIERLKVDSVILVTDGVSDESIMPIIESRVKIEATEIVYVKQAKELEKAYFLFVEKLKDPYYAKFIFGIPALLILSVAFISLFNVPWQFFAFLVGIYLLSKGFGIDEKVKEALDINISGTHSLLFGLIFLIFTFIALFSSFSAFEKRINEGKLIAYVAAIDNLITFLFLFFFVILLIKLFRSYIKSNIIKIFNSTSSALALITIVLVLKIFVQWIINEEPPFISFIDAVKYTFLVFTLFYILSFYLNLMKKKFLTNANIEGMFAYNSFGDLEGNVKSKEDDKIIIKTNFGKKILLSVDDIVDIEQNHVIVRV